MIFVKYAGLFVLVSLLSIFTIAKPVKIFYPQLAGVQCPHPWLCVDDLSKVDEARLLYENALKGVELKLSSFDHKPRVIFCSAPACFAAFGFEKEAATSIGSLGVIVAPRGWTQYFVEHELIHQWQSENFGLLAMTMAPTWLKEGMAYSLSDDPRAVLQEPFQSFRSEYRSKFAQLEGEALRVALSDEF